MREPTDVLLVITVHSHQARRGDGNRANFPQRKPVTRFDIQRDTFARHGRARSRGFAA